MNRLLTVCGIVIGGVAIMGWLIMADRHNYPSDDMSTPAWVAWRLRPIGDIVIQPQEKNTPEQLLQNVVRTQCGVCHLNGVNDAPRLDKPKDWQHRKAAGLSALVRNTIQGKGAMPPRGGFELNDTQIYQSVLLMAQTVGLDFPDQGDKNNKNIGEIK